MKIVILFFLMSPLVLVQSVCIRDPAFGSCDNAPNEQCEPSHTCQLNCGSNSNIANITQCPDEDLSCGHSDSSSSCAELKSQETCNANLDCLWAGSNAVEGPFACGTKVVLHVGFSYGLELRSGNTCLSDDVCGISTSAIGEWYALRGIDAPFHISTYGTTDVDTVLAVFTADSNLALTCIANNDDFEGSSYSEVNINGKADQVYYVFVANKDGSGGRIKLHYHIGSAQAACMNGCSNMFYMDPHQTERLQISCSCQEGADGDYTAVVKFGCEQCDKDGNGCILQTWNTHYEANGRVRSSVLCYQITEGFGGKTICSEYSHSDGSGVYSVNGKVCPQEQIGTCVRHDCSKFQEGAVFSGCNLDEGYVGIFRFEGQLVSSNNDGDAAGVDAFEKGQCKGPRSHLSSAPRIFNVLWKVATVVLLLYG